MNACVTIFSVVVIPISVRKGTTCSSTFLEESNLSKANPITSNVKADKTLVVVKNGEERHETGLKKFGAMLGDHVEVGCNSVLNPGSVICPNTNIYPLSPIRGFIPENCIVKTGNVIVEKK